MTEDRSLERAARSWLEIGPTEAPERAIDAALLQIETTPQERDWHVPWRLPQMTTPARVAAAAVVGVLAIGGALFVLRPGDSSVGGPGATVSPSSTPTPVTSLAPSPAGAYPLTEGPLVAGTYVATPLARGMPGGGCMDPPQPGCSESAGASIRVTFTVPDGWAGILGGVWLADQESSAPSGATMGFGRGSWLHSDPCVTAERDAAPDGAPPDVPVGPSVDDFADALADHPLLDATDPVPVALGGYPGKYVDLRLPSDIAGCEAGYFPWEPGIYAQGPSHRWHLWILDVDGVRLVVATTDYAGTSPQHRAELEAMVDSIQIEP